MAASQGMIAFIMGRNPPRCNPRERLALFLRAGTGGVLLGLGARDPRPDDLEERQLTNLVSEIPTGVGSTRDTLASGQRVSEMGCQPRQ
jgi:hypothetical protein